MNEKAEFAERLKAALLDAGYEPRPVVVERNFNLRYWGRPVTFQAARRWLRGEAIPEQDKLVVLAEWLNVEAPVLRYGAPATRKAAPSKRWDDGLAAEDRLMIESFLKLPDSRRKILRDVVRVFLEAEQGTGKRKT